MPSRPLRVGAALLLVAFVQDPSPASLAAPPDREAAYRFNNLGVALLEQFRFADAAEQFEKAVAADPGLALARINLAIAYFYVPDVPAARKEAEAAAASAPEAPQPHYLLGLIARMDNRPDDAVASLQKVLAADPRDLGANLVLGQVYLQQRRFDEALAAFRIATAVEPYNVSAAYNLGVALTRSGQREEGAAQMARFQELRDSGYKTSFGQTYLEQGRYAEALASTGAEAHLVDPKTPAVAFREAAGAVPGSPGAAGPALLGRALAPSEVEAALREGGRAAVVLADLDGDGDHDVVEVRGGVLRALRNDAGKLTDVTASAGLAGVEARAAVAGDYDNDGRPDLLVLKPGGLALFHNEGEGRFEDATASAQLPAYPHLSLSAAFLDIDHDGDLDVFVAGLADVAGTKDAGKPLAFPGEFAPAPSLLLQNNGNGTFTDVTEKAKLGAAGHAVAVAPTDYDNRRDLDLLVVRWDGRPVLFKNLRDGTFADAAAELGLPAGGPFASVAAADVNKDGFTDFFLGSAAGPGTFVLSDGRLGFAVQPGPDGSDGASAAQFVDYDADGLLDLVAATASGLRVFRNTGDGWADASPAALAGDLRTAPLEGAALAIADLDADGDQDVLLATAGGLRLLGNEGGNANRTFPVRLLGRVTNKEGVGAKVDIRAGSLRQKVETSAAVPAVGPSDVVFGLGRRTAPDAVRIIWVSGIVQTETEVPSPAPGVRTAFDVTELDRKPSSCPYLYAWNGERFEFVSDFLGGGELGYYLAPGTWNVPDPEEYVRIRGDQLREKDGRYELRVTNELEEVLYLDRLRLLAVAHPANVEIFPDEGMVHPPKAYRLFAVRDAVEPPKAEDARGRDVRDRVARIDRRFVDGFPLHRIRGYAEEHALVLDLAGLSPDHTLLLLTGWTDYAFSSDNVAAHQAGLAMKPPVLQVEDGTGEWRTVAEDVGIPVGRPQTLVVDLAGKWLSPSRRVRVLTNMRIYWDEVRVGAPAGVEPAVARLDPVRADLAERGFSAETSPDGREPWIYDYARASWVSPWKTMPGRYTREGDVRALLASTDDLFVVSKPGDVVALSFDARALPPLPAGWTRTFLLHGDGYSKEMDINSASPDVVLPLPFHGMARYPYPPEEAPERPRRAAARAEAWNTRVVARPLFPIELWAAGEGLSPGGRDGRATEE